MSMTNLACTFKVGFSAQRFLMKSLYFLDVL